MNYDPFLCNGGDGVLSGADSSDILLQYIGRKDKHNTDVYNGDIIKTGPVKIERIGEPFIGRIYWFEREFQWWITDDTQDAIVGIDYDVTFLDNYQDFEVIGNIYEHPELLESKKG